jgi:beta-barrel assembly-enhancing protease
MNRRTVTINLIAIAAVFSLLAVQELPAKDTDAKKKLSVIQKNIQKKTATVMQAVQAKIPLQSDLPDSDEVALGRETAGRLLSAQPLLKNDSLERYLNLVGVWVALQSPRANLRWTFGIIESEDINAFALPGGFIFVTAGLYALLRNEAELAAILGHEIAHVNLRHHVRLMQKDKLLAQGSGYLSNATRQGAIKSLCGQGAEICARSLDKNAEFESDCTGLSYAAAAGYDPYAYIDVLDRLGANNQNDRLALLYKTHPHPSDRLKALEEKIGGNWSSSTIKGVVPARWMKLQ